MIMKVNDWIIERMKEKIKRMSEWLNEQMKMNAQVNKWNIQWSSTMINSSMTLYCQVSSVIVIIGDAIDLNEDDLAWPLSNSRSVYSKAY